MSEYYDGVRFDFYDEQGRKVSSENDPEFLEFMYEPENVKSEQIAIAETLALDKDDEFIAAESEARIFWQSLGFDGLCPTYLLDEGEQLQDISVFDEEVTVATHHFLTDLIFVRNKVLEKARASYGPNTAAVVLAHEFGHATSGKLGRLAVQRTAESYDFNVRSGFSIGLDGSTEGSIYEEGFAALCHGWFIRSREDPLALPIGIEGLPSAELPEYLRPFDPRMRSGPDGYIMELLAWGAEQRGVMSSSDFVANLLETRRPETEAQALRTFARTVNSLRPGLYVELRGLPYEKDALATGLNTVLDALRLSRRRVAIVA